MADTQFQVQRIQRYVDLTRLILNASEYNEQTVFVFRQDPDCCTEKAMVLYSLQSGYK